MPYTPGPFIGPHLYLQWGGKLPGSESWSCGLRLSPVGGGPWPPEGASGLLAACTTAVQTFHTAPGAKVSSAAKLSFVKLNMIDTDGHYSLDTTNQTILADVAGNAAGVQPPNQITLAITLETGFSRGAAHRGRFYMPIPVIPAQTDGTILIADATGVKTAANAFLTALNAVSASYKVAVHSRKSGAATQRLVTTMSVGRVLDTQRRRRRSLMEQYV